MCEEETMLLLQEQKVVLLLALLIVWFVCLFIVSPFNKTLTNKEYITYYKGEKRKKSNINDILQ